MRKVVPLYEVDLYVLFKKYESCDYFTPEIAHTKTGVLPKRWKQYPYRKKVIEDG